MKAKVDSYVSDFTAKAGDKLVKIPVNVAKPAIGADIEIKELKGSDRFLYIAPEAKK